MKMLAVGINSTRSSTAHENSAPWARCAPRRVTTMSRSVASTTAASNAPRVRTLGSVSAKLNV